MYNNQPEKYVSTVFAFGEKGQFSATSAAFIRSLTAPGGATAVSTEFAIVIPRNGTLKNLFWSAEGSTLTATGNKITVYVNGSPTGLMVTWNAAIKAGSNTSNFIPVLAGDKVSIYIQLATGQTGKIISQPRASVELEVDDTNPNPWDLTGTVVSYLGGKVGIGSNNPLAELHVRNAISGATAGLFETTSNGKLVSGNVGGIEKFNVDGNGNMYTAGKVGIGNNNPLTELDVNGTIQTQNIKITSGAANGLVLTSDINGNGTWQAIGGAQSTIDGSGTVNAIPLFLGATTLDDSNIFQDGGNIGIGTSTPQTALDVNGAISGFGIVPIGSIIAWHKSLFASPILPEGWLECNGSVINDIASPFNGMTIPNLNNEGRFLRGSNNSGTLQDDAVQAHKHNESGHSHIVSVNGHGQAGGYGNYGTSYNGNADISTSAAYVDLGNPVDSGTGAGTVRIANETRSINMSVVWIMRIK